MMFKIGLEVFEQVPFCSSYSFLGEIISIHVTVLQNISIQKKAEERGRKKHEKKQRKKKQQRRRRTCEYTICVEKSRTNLFFSSCSVAFIMKVTS